jgi:ankyrin repeat protein
MASNNLAVGAKALLEAGADPQARTPHGETPMAVARQSAAFDVISVLLKHL